MTKPEYIHIIDAEKGDEDQEKKRGNIESLNNAMSLASVLGMQIAFPIVFGVGLGYWIDKLNNSQPTFTLSLLFFGIIVSFYTLIKKVKDPLNK